MKINGHIFGVGFLLFTSGNGAPRLFTVKELKSKPQYFKSSGMVSFPLETFEEKDGSFKTTIERLLREEIGISPQEVRNCCVVKEKFQLIPGRNDIYTIYGYGLFSGYPKDFFIPEDNDIKFSGWKTIDELLQQNTRVETRPILEHFRRNHFRELFGKIY
jgi:hypothetical protein